MLFIMAALIFDHLVWYGWVLYAGDAWMQYYPAKAYTYLHMKQGHLPLWTPNLAFGYPFFAEAQAGMLYPLHLALLAFSTSTAYSLSVILRYILSGLFMFLYIRHITRNVWASAVGSLAFAFSGYMIAQVIHENVENALIWLPLILLLLDKWLVTANRRALIGAGLFMGVSFLAGYFYISLLMLTMTTCYYLYFRLLRHKDERGTWNLAFLSRVSGGLMAFGLLAVGMACVQLLPNYELAQESTRAGGLDYNTSTQVSFPPFNLITFFFPKFFGHPSDSSLYWGLWKGNFIDLVVYIGILPFLLMLAALFIRRDRYTLFFGLVFVSAIGLALGQFSPLWYIWNHLPVFSMMRNPARFLSLIVASGAILAGLGLDALLRSAASDPARRARYRRVVFTGAIAILALSLTGGMLITLFRSSIIRAGQWFIDAFVVNQSTHQQSRAYYYGLLEGEFKSLETVTQIDHPFLYPSILLLCVSAAIALWLAARPRAPGIAGPIVVFITSLDLFWFADGYNFTLPPHAYDQKPAYFKPMEQDHDMFRYSAAPVAVSLRNYDPLLFDQMWIQVKSPLQLHRHTALVEALRPMMSDLADASALHPLINLLNIKYIVTGDSLRGAWAALRLDEGVKVYENKTVMPRAFMVPQARVLPTPQDVLTAMTDPDFRPAEAVLLEDPPALSLTSSASTDTSVVQIRQYDPGYIAIDITTDGGFLVLTDTWYPGWKAYADGSERAILRADYLFRAIPVEPGRHRVEFRYEPFTFKAGALISALTLLAGCILLLFPRPGRS